MRDIRALLIEADPVRTEPGLSEADADRMRRVMLSAPRAAQSEQAFWPPTLAVAAIVVVMAVGGTFVGGRLPAPRHETTGATAVPEAAGERRQVQFATPGGTRIIWTLDPDFKLREATP